MAPSWTTQGRLGETRSTRVFGGSSWSERGQDQAACRTGPCQAEILNNCGLQSPCPRQCSLQHLSQAGCLATSAGLLAELSATPVQPAQPRLWSRPHPQVMLTSSRVLRETPAATDTKTCSAVTTGATSFRTAGRTWGLVAKMTSEQLCSTSWLEWVVWQPRACRGTPGPGLHKRASSHTTSCPASPESPQASFTLKICISPALNSQDSPSWPCSSQTSEPAPS